MMRWIAIMVGLMLAVPALADAVDVSGIVYHQNLGARLPDTSLTDETGAPARLLTGRPVILVLGYYNCPSLCGIVRADLLDAIGHTGLTAGKDYDLVVV